MRSFRLFGLFYNYLILLRSRYTIPYCNVVGRWVPIAYQCQNHTHTQGAQGLSTVITVDRECPLCSLIPWEDQCEC